MPTTELYWGKNQDLFKNYDMIRDVLGNNY